ncbi:MAG TPA: dihydrolipoyllysine-residue acetyltransferase [Burkholderiales bacterium]|jgi:pyruvate dehydrogenase E2 component (dihydrolipoamide acetyltransferase)|nr:dihydrolipoyllysine-residue acetyltransferase [Burkholderiales bacterium]
MSDTIEVKVPDIGDYKDVPIIEVFVKPGDDVNAEDSLITVESDKATMEVPSPTSGKVKELRVKVGDKVSEGSLVLVLEAADAKSKPQQAPTQSASVAPIQPVPPTRAQQSSPAATGPQRAPEQLAGSAPAQQRAVIDEAGFGHAHASPSVRRLAREFGVDLSKLKGSGPKERILKEDVQAYVKVELAKPRGAEGGSGMGLNLPPAPQVDFSKFGPVKTQPLPRIKKISGAFLHRNWLTIPHVTQHEEADITELEAFRKSQSDEAKKQGIRFTILGFLMKASVVALKNFPEFNASLSPDGESLVLKQYFHIGVAVDTPNGLVVPVIRDVDKKGLLELARELGEVSERMRGGKISPADLQGGCFSISSLGGIGGTFFTPIINAPEVAILGVGKAVVRPVWNGKEFAPRLMLPLSLSYDHRVIDGALGARFISFLAGVLGDIRKLVL